MTIPQITFYRTPPSNNYTGQAIDVLNNMCHFLNGKLHCETGPAVYGGNITAYYVNGKLHRTDGPALVYNSDASKGFYYLNNTRYDFDDDASWIKYTSMLIFK